MGSEAFVPRGRESGAGGRGSGRGDGGEAEAGAEVVGWCQRVDPGFGARERQVVEEVVPGGGDVEDVIPLEEVSMLVGCRSWGGVWSLLTSISKAEFSGPSIARTSITKFAGKA